MYVIDVIPLSRTAPGVLSYRSAKDMPAGTIVNITVRKTATQGIVIGSLPVEDAKEMLKHARFMLAKSAPSASGSLPEEILRAAKETAAYHATNVGAVLAAVFAEHIRAGVPLTGTSLQPGTLYAREAIELPLSGRVQAYEKIIQACTDRGEATLLVVPTLPELSYWKSVLAPHKPLILSGSVTGARRTKALEAATSHTGLIIATPSFSLVPVQNLGAIILERVSAGTYTLPKRPYLSMAYALDALAKARNLPIIFGDFPLPLEYRPEPTKPLKASTMSAVSCIDARREKREKKGDEKQSQNEDTGPWRAIPESVAEGMKTELASGGSVVVLAVRKGYAPGVICRDCGQAQTDERDVPLSFTTAGGTRLLVTSDGVTALDAKRVCQRCGSWNLLPLGVGIERVEEELKTAFPDVPISMVPPELLSSPRKTKDEIAKLRPGSILIGTEGVLPWLLAHMPNDARRPLGVIASADNLLALPFWRARERFVRLSLLLAGLCREVLLVTRHPEDAAVDLATHAHSPRFWEEETMLRKALQYPPFGTLITLTFEGLSRKVVAHMETIKADLAAYDPSTLPLRMLSETIVRGVLVLTLPDGVWPDDALVKCMRALPPNVRVRIDPESLW